MISNSPYHRGSDMKKAIGLFNLAIALAMSSASFSAKAMTDAELKTITEQRLLGDRTGACVAVAVIEKTVSRAYVCADAKKLNRISPNSAFEIGSITKTMAAALLADLILQGKASLDDPISKYLPKDAVVPSFEGKPILLKHIVTHTSGLPVVPDFGAADMVNPYANIDEASLLKTLSQAKLKRAPGSEFEYSNYAMMLLTSMIAKHAGSDFETLLQTRLFTPIGMKNSYVNLKPKGIDAAQGHTPNQKTTSAWKFKTNTAGVGGVRATLDDMVSYVQAQLGTSTSAISPALKLTQQIVKTDANQKMGMNWLMGSLDNHFVHAHGGGTGGFSAHVAFDLDTKRGVVILSDTALTSVGGLSSLSNHLQDSRLPLGKARLVKAPDVAMLDALVGQYDVQPGMKLFVSREGSKLFTQATGQEKFEMAYDSEGDFFPLEFDAILRPKKRADGGYSLALLQGGAVIPLKKIESKTGSSMAMEKLKPEQLEPYAGTYQLKPGFDLKVFVQAGKLMAQATGQGSFEIEATAKDKFAADAFGIEIHFERDAHGDAKSAVKSLALLQGGQTTRGERK
jgi:serine-type D-Ala-D-Ala carboxypeptidase/endopeptidase